MCGLQLHCNMKTTNEFDFDFDFDFSNLYIYAVNYQKMLCNSRKDPYSDQKGNLPKDPSSGISNDKLPVFTVTPSK